MSSAPTPARLQCLSRLPIRIGSAGSTGSAWLALSAKKCDSGEPFQMLHTIFELLDL